MTTTAPLLKFLRTMPGRCQRCGRHTETQGHATTCIHADEGRRLAAEGMARTVAAHPDAVSLVDAAIMRRVRGRQPFSANTIRAELVDLTPSERPVIGAEMNSLARRLCNKVGEEPSSDPGTHGKKVTIWLAKDAA